MFTLFGPSVQTVSPDDVQKALATKDQIVLLDVRTKDEYSQGKIVGSVHLPLSDLESNISSVVPDKASTIYVYCLSGGRSASAVGILSKMGYTKAFTMSGGIGMWKVKGFPVG
ncbi:MAG: rhodanese-like domain-containing protein [bacterium]